MPVKLNSTGGGSVTLAAPTTATDYTVTFPAATGNVVVAGSSSALTQGTSQASTSGTSIDFTGIPSWVERVTVIFSGVSTSGTNNLQVQIGSGSFATSGYSSVSSITGGGTQITPTAVVASGMVMKNDTGAGSSFSGAMVFVNLTGNTWVQTHTYADTGTARTGMGSGNVSLAGSLDRVRITTVGGTDTFDSGSINIIYE